MVILSPLFDISTLGCSSSHPIGLVDTDHRSLGFGSPLDGQCMVREELRRILACCPIVISSVMLFERMVDSSLMMICADKGAMEWQNNYWLHSIIAPGVIASIRK